MAPVSVLVTRLNKYKGKSLAPLSSSSHPKKNCGRVKGKGNYFFKPKRMDRFVKWIGEITLEACMVWFDISNRFKSVPYERDSESRVLTVQRMKSKVDLFLWHCFSLKTFLYLIFKTVRLGDVIKVKGLSSALIVHICFVGQLLLLSIIHLNFVAKPKEFVFLINQIEAVHVDFAKRGLIVQRWWTKFITIALVWYQGFIVVLYILGVFFLFCLNPNESHYLYSAFPKEMKRTGLFLACCCLEFVTTVGNMSLIINMVCICVSYFLSTTGWLEAITVKTKKKGRISNFQTYKFLQLLTLLFNDCCSRIFAPFFTLYLCLFNIGSLYATLRGVHSLPLHIYLMFPLMYIVGLFIMIVCYSQCAKVSIYSIKVIKLLKSEQRSHFAKNQVLHRKIQKSLGKFGIQLASICKVNLVTVISMIEFTFSGTLLVLTF